MRKPLFLGVGLVGAAMLFFAIAKRLRGSMLPPLPDMRTERHLGKGRFNRVSHGRRDSMAMLVRGYKGGPNKRSRPRSFIEKALARFGMKEHTKRERITDISPGAEE